MPKKIAIVTTHPIQYNAPFFNALSLQRSIEVKVFYTWGKKAVKKYDPGFGKIVEWDIPLLDGHQYCFAENVASDPGSHHFFGIDNPALISEMEAWKPAAVLVYGWSFKSHLKILRHFKGRVPVLFRGDSTLIDKEHPLKQFARRTFLAWVYRHVDIALYTGRENKAYFLRHGLTERQLIFMPHAVDINRFRQTAATREGQYPDLPGPSGTEKHIVRFLYAGKFTENKNVSLLIDAFLAAGLQNAQLLLAGNGPMEEKLKSMANGNDRIRFLPFQNQADMPRLLSAADVVVLPSKRAETWGLIINEAMACGKAVLVSSACGCAGDLVHPGQNGLVFRNNDKAELSRALVELANSAEALDAMGQRSAQIIRAWSFEKGVSALTTFCETLK